MNIFNHQFCWKSGLEWIKTFSISINFKIIREKNAFDIHHTVQQPRTRLIFHWRGGWNEPGYKVDRTQVWRHHISPDKPCHFFLTAQIWVRYRSTPPKTLIWTEKITSMLLFPILHKMFLSRMLCLAGNQALRDYKAWMIGYIWGCKIIILRAINWWKRKKSFYFLTFQHLWWRDNVRPREKQQPLSISKV